MFLSAKAYVQLQLKVIEANPHQEGFNLANPCEQNVVGSNPSADKGYFIVKFCRSVPYLYNRQAVEFAHCTSK